MFLGFGCMLLAAGFQLSAVNPRRKPQTLNPKLCTPNTKIGPLVLLILFRRDLEFASSGFGFRV